LDKTIYESSNKRRRESSNGICLGRITNVDIDTRLCRIKTFFGPAEFLDLDLKDVQWVNVDGNADGDESGSIPREGAVGLVFFIEGEAYIFGFIKPLNGSKGAVTGKESVNRLVRGDKIISTKSGNYLVIRTNGSIEIQSRETLKTVYIPTDSRIIEICRNFNFKTDGGYINWENTGSALLGQQLFTQEFRKDLARSFIVVEERGAVSTSTIYKTAIGPGIPGVPGVPAAVYEFTVDITGKTHLGIGPGVPVMTADIGVDGSIEVVSFSDISVTSKLGDVSVEADVGSISVTAKLGDISAEANVGDISVKATAGNIAVEATAGDVSAKATAGAISVEASLGDVKVKATAGAIEMEGSLGKLKLGKGKVGIGGPAAELVDQVIQLLTQLDLWITQTQVSVHIGNLGYPTAPPTEATAYIPIQAQIGVIKGLLTSIKGGV